MRYDWRVIATTVAVAAIAGWVVTRSGSAPDEDLDDIDRDLAELTQALRLDQTIESELIPPADAETALPTTLQYRRVVQFWQPALASMTRRERRRRSARE